MFGHMGGFGMGFGGLFTLIIIVFVIWLIAKGSNKNIDGGFFTKREEKDPLQILKERYAKGEIDDEEFERRKKLIEK